MAANSHWNSHRSRRYTWYMKDPHPGLRVWVICLSGTFTILAVNADQRTVDLESIDTHKIEKSISFDVVKPLGGETSQRFR